MTTPSNCVEIQRLLWSGEDAQPLVASHLTACGDCQVEARRAHDLSLVLVSLGNELAVVPSGLRQSIVDALPRSPVDRARDVVSHPKFWRGAAVGAAAATVAAFGFVVARRFVRPDLVG